MRFFAKWPAKRDGLQPMPPLDNARHERFAQEVAKGMAAGRAYEAAGYDSEGAAADVCASKLLRNAKVTGRIAELQQKGAAKAEVTVAWLLETAQGIITEARAAADFGAASATLERAAKIAGLWVDRSEGKQTIREFSAQPATPEEWEAQYARPPLAN